jgi:hypothetical protein
MSQIILELNNSEDENLLLILLQRLGISYSLNRKETPETKNLDHYRQIIQQGANIKNFAEFMRDFEQSRQDRELPFRNE